MGLQVCRNRNRISAEKGQLHMTRRLDFNARTCSMHLSMAPLGVLATSSEPSSAAALQQEVKQAAAAFGHSADLPLSGSKQLSNIAQDIVRLAEASEGCSALLQWAVHSGNGGW